MATDVTYCVDLGEPCVDAAKLEGDLDTYRAQLVGEFPLYGELIISAPERPSVQVRDELAAAVHQICFAAIPEILAGRTYVYTFFSASGRLVFIPSTVFVEVMGDGVERTSFSRDELLPALYAAGQRYVGLLQRLDSEDHKATAAELAKHAASARQALEAQRLL